MNMHENKENSDDIFISEFFDLNDELDELDVFDAIIKYSLQGTTQGRYLTGGVPPVRFSM